MIRLAGVSREFRTGPTVVRALDGIDWHLPPGGFAVLMGPSGSGKSTLLNVIGCLDRPTSGTFHLDGENVTALPDAELTRLRRDKLGFVFQSFHLVPRLTALRNVALPMAFAGVPGAEQTARAAAALESVGLAPRSHHRPDELSGGECQRVAIARALAMDPPVLLADEPTGNLDTKSGGEIIELLRALNAAGRTVVMVTHDTRLSTIGSTLVQMEDGRIAAETAT